VGWLGWLGFSLHVFVVSLSQKRIKSFPSSWRKMPSNNSAFQAHSHCNLFQVHQTHPTAERRRRRRRHEI